MGRAHSAFRVRRHGLRPRVLAALLLSGFLAGCAGSSNIPLASSGSAVTGSTIAFESIDGPPPDVFDRLVAALNDEAAARRIAVVSRASPAAYRVRSYLSAVVEGDKTSFAWVWDLYDNDRRRALRLSGEEPAARPGRSGWAGADDQVLRRMARDGMARLAAFLDAPGEAPPDRPPPSTGPAAPVLVSQRDDSPEAAGIVRLRSGEEQPRATTLPTVAAHLEAPPRRTVRTAKPRPAIKPRPAMMATLDAGRAPPPSGP